MGVEGASSKLKRVARKMVVAACASFSSRKPSALVDPLSVDSSVNVGVFFLIFLFSVSRFKIIPHCCLIFPL